MSVIRSQCKSDEEYLLALRDDFAAKAMQGCCAKGDGSLGGDGSAEAVASWSYEIADAMLKARES